MPATNTTATSTSMLVTKEHIDLVDMFEREHKGCFRFDKETKAMWSRGIVYQDGTANMVFLAYRRGYAFGKAIGRDE